MSSAPDSQRRPAASGGAVRPPTTLLRPSSAPLPAPAGGRPPVPKLREKRPSFFSVHTLLLVMAAGLIAFCIRYFVVRAQETRTAQAKEELQAHLAGAQQVLETIRQTGATALEHERQIAERARAGAEAVAAVRAEAAVSNAAPVVAQSPPAAQASAPAPGADTSEAPPGEMTRAQLDAMRQGQKPSASTLSAPPAAAKPRARLPVDVLADRLSAETQSATDDAQRVRQAQSNAEDLYGQFAAATDPTVSGERLEDLKTCAAEVAGIEKGLLQTLASVQKSADEAAALRKQAEADRTSRLEAEGRQEIERQHRLAVTREVDAAETAHKQCRDLLKHYDLAAAVRILTEQQAADRTEEGRAAIAVLLDRYTRIKALQEFLVKQINANPPRWGWIQDASPRDIVKADTILITITGKTVPWADVGLPQMVHLLKRYLAQGPVPARQRGEQSLAAAILCYEDQNDTLAAAFAQQALALNSGLDEDRARLLPADLEAPDAASPANAPPKKDVAKP